MTRNYIVKISIPVKRNRWQADLCRRVMNAENLNQIIMEAVTVEEYKAGARIVEVWEHNEDYTYSRIV